MRLSDAIREALLLQRDGPNVVCGPNVVLTNAIDPSDTVLDGTFDLDRLARDVRLMMLHPAAGRLYARDYPKAGKELKTLEEMGPGAAMDRYLAEASAALGE